MILNKVPSKLKLVVSQSFIMVVSRRKYVLNLVIYVILFSLLQIMDLRKIIQGRNRTYLVVMPEKLYFTQSFLGTGRIFSL